MLSLPKHLALSTNSINRISIKGKMLRQAQHDVLFVRLLLHDYLKGSNALLQRRDFCFGVGQLLALALQHVGLGVLGKFLVAKLLLH